jgi:hypothetical protein
MLKQSVVEAWHSFSEPLEGRVPHMYLDVLGLVTCAVGILVDGSQTPGNVTPWAPALLLPWKRDSDGLPANDFEIRDAWSRLKARPDLAHRNVSHARALTGLHLDDADIDALVADKLESNAAFIAEHYFFNFPSFPADAQLAIMSIAWACGPGFPAKWPNFRAAVEAENWLGARDNCDIRIGTPGTPSFNPGVVPRNKANRVCLANAAIITAEHMAPELLSWPSIAAANVPPSDRVANHGTLVYEAIEDHREYMAAAAERAQSRIFNAAEDFSDDDEPTRPETPVARNA